MVLVGTCRWEFETGPIHTYQLSKTRQFSNHESRLLSRAHTFAIIVILDLKIHQSMWIYWSFFSKNLNQRSLTPTWPLIPCLLRSHVWLYPRIIVSKSHDNTSMYVDTVINLANYHIHTHVHIHTYYIQNEWSHSLLLNSVQARQKSDPFIYQPTRFWSKFWQSYLPPFFYLLFFVFQVFLDLSQFWLKLQKKLKNRLIHIQNFA